jgi:hypothetical protein
MAKVGSPSSLRSPGVPGSAGGIVGRSPVGALRSPSGVGRGPSVEALDARVLHFRCRRVGETRVTGTS